MSNGTFFINRTLILDTIERDYETRAAFCRATGFKASLLWHALNTGRVFKKTLWQLSEALKIPKEELIATEQQPMRKPRGLGVAIKGSKLAWAMLDEAESVAAFSRKTGISVSMLYYWLDVQRMNRKKLEELCSHLPGRQPEEFIKED